MMRFVGLLVLLVVPATARAHGRDPERRLVLQRDAKGLAALWQVTLVGKSAETLFAAQDRDRDGVLSDTEGKRLAAVLLAKATRGAELFCDGEPLEISALEA